MSYGLYDGDWCLYGKAPFNLEIMKMATYYRNKRQIVGLSMEFNPDMYTNFVYRKDYQDGYYERKISQYSNIQCGGLSFTAGLYAPMDLDIERTKPDTSIYAKLLRNIVLSNSEKEDFQALLKACHFRLSLDNQTVWEDYMVPIYSELNTILFYAHDPNLGGISGAPAAIKVLLESSPGKHKKLFGCKFPIIIDDYDLLKEWLDIPLHRLAIIIYKNVLTPEQIVELSEYPQSQLDKLQYNVTVGCKNTQDFVDNRLQQVFRTVAFLRMKRKRILLIYDTQYIVEKEWESFFKLLNGYTNTKKLRKDDYDIIIKYDSFYNFVRKLSEQKLYLHHDFMTPDEMRKVFLFISNLSYEVFDDFYNCHTVHIENGRFERDEQTE